MKEGGEIGAVGSVSTAAHKKISRINLADVPNSNSIESAAIRLQLDQIDRQLLNDVANARLWQERAAICRRMHLYVSAVVSQMHAALLKKDDQILAKCIFEFTELRPEFNALNQETVSEVDKGRLLANIRNESVNCEFYYMLMLAYAAKFNDIDIFMQAVTSMKTSFPGENRQFYRFNENRSASVGGMNVENRVELLTENNFAQISLNVKKFLQQVGSCSDLSCVALARFQLHKILTFHLSRKSADALVSLSAFGDSSGFYQNKIVPENEGFLEFFYRRIDNWLESIEYPKQSPAISRWIKLMVMDKIRETSLKDFFTGDLYKPPYLFKRHEEEEDGLLKVSWIKALPLDQFPDVCDGRPIARAIYYRFANGNSDWDEYFKWAMKTGQTVAVSKTQRLLLLMVSEFGPHPAFKQYIMPLVINRPPNDKFSIYDLTMYCDMFRLCLAYRQPIDEQRLFNILIRNTPMPPKGWEEFRSSAEWIILCLLLTSSPARRFQLDNLTVRTVHWMREAKRKNSRDQFAEALTIYCLLCIGILADLVPEKLELHQLLEKRKVIWMEHALAASARGEKAFAEWQKACGF